MRSFVLELLSVDITSTFFMSQYASVLMPADSWQELVDLSKARSGTSSIALHVSVLRICYLQQGKRENTDYSGKTTYHRGIKLMS
jgi:hypothetical protein